MEQVVGEEDQGEGEVDEDIAEIAVCQRWPGGRVGGKAVERRYSAMSSRGLSTMVGCSLWVPNDTPHAVPVDPLASRLLVSLELRIREHFQRVSHTEQANRERLDSPAPV